MIYALLLALVAFMVLPAAIGTLVLFHTLIRRKKAPADQSNRIGHLRLVWFALKHEDRFVNLFRREYPTHAYPNGKWVQAFPWLQMDEGEAVNHDHD